MSLYDGFNGFQIGSGLNALHQGMAARNGQAMQGLGAALDGFVQNLQEQNREKARKKSALDYLLRNGYSKEQAEQVTNTVGPEIVGQLMQWNKQKEDLAEQRAYESRVRGLNQRHSNLQQILAKARDSRLPSQTDIDEYNAFVKEYIDYVNKNPDLIGEMAGFAIGKSPYANVKSYEQWLSEIPNGVDASDFQKFKEEAIGRNTWASLMNDPDFAAKWDLALSKVAGDQTTRDALMLGSGKIATEQDAAKKKEQIDFNRRIEHLKSELLLGKRPEMKKAEFDALTKNKDIRNILEMWKRQGYYNYK